MQTDNRGSICKPAVLTMRYQVFAKPGCESGKIFCLDLRMPAQS
jgi:hypothetical protein